MLSQGDLSQMLLVFGRNLYIPALCNWQRINKVQRAERIVSCQKMQMSQCQNSDFLKEETFFLIIKGPKKSPIPPSTPQPCTKFSTPGSVLPLEVVAS